ncbi:MAG: AAA family ATPase [Bryobacterales bacterium]|nr:AAA family ATPase [Bryobacterales bacterium]
MLTRVYIDNYKCFVNFEYRPARRQLILGANGSGKSSLLDALLTVRQFVIRGDKAEDLFVAASRTRWLPDQPRQTFEIEAQVGESCFVYRLAIEALGDPALPRVIEETVQCDQKPVFEFVNGEVRLYNDQFQHKVTYPFDPHQSALATIRARPENQTLMRFVGWFGGLLCFRINPFSMGTRAEKEDLFPRVDLANFASWYRHWSQSDPNVTARYIESLRQVLDGFGVFALKVWAEPVRLLIAEFDRSGGERLRFGFAELSEGQRCLACLYAILHFVLAQGGTVILDEPDNFVALREIQPWLMACEDAVDEGSGQILVISHHPEILNQWAVDAGVVFRRDGVGSVRAEKFQGDPAIGLTPAELVARGWNGE